MVLWWLLGFDFQAFGACGPRNKICPAKKFQVPGLADSATQIPHLIFTYIPMSRDRHVSVPIRSKCLWLRTQVGSLSIDMAFGEDKPRQNLVICNRSRCKWTGLTHTHEPFTQCRDPNQMRLRIAFR